jgi:hypothetical protein
MDQLKLERSSVEAPSSNPISILALDQMNVEASVHDLLINNREKEALSLTGDAAEAFLNVLQKASLIPCIFIFFHSADENSFQV